MHVFFEHPLLDIAVERSTTRVLRRNTWIIKKLKLIRLRFVSSEYLHSLEWASSDFNLTGSCCIQYFSIVEASCSDNP